MEPATTLPLALSGIQTIKPKGLQRRQRPQWSGRADNGVDNEETYLAIAMLSQRSSKGGQART